MIKKTTQTGFVLLFCCETRAWHPRRARDDLTTDSVRFKFPPIYVSVSPVASAA